MRIAVVGGGIAGLAAAWEVVRRGGTPIVLEAGARPGGKVQTTSMAGLAVETAPDSFLARRPEAVQLCEELGLRDELVAPAIEGSYLYSRGQLRRLPAGQVLGVPTDFDALEASGVLSPAGVARARQEPDLPGEPLQGDTSVGELIRRRFGDEVADRLVDPLVGGINAGRIDSLSLEVAAAQLAAAARRDASLTRALRSAPPGQVSGPVFLTLPGGLGRLVDRLVEAITAAGGEVRTGTSVAAPVAADAGYDVAGERVDGIVVATPAWAAADVLAPLAPDVAAALATIDYASVSLATFAVPAEALTRPLDATGYLVPRPEGLLLTAATWASSKWSHLARDGQVLIRASAGRVDDSRHLELDDDALVRRLLADLSSTMGLRGEPDEVRVHRWPRSFPQFAPGHLDEVARLQGTLAAHHPRIGLAGAWVGGVGIPACIGSGRTAAARVVAQGTGPYGTNQ